MHTKATLTLLILFLTGRVFAQSKTEAEVLGLSGEIFRWELESKWDSLAYIMDDKAVIFNSAGFTKTKNEYLIDLRNGRPVHNNINVEQSSVNVTDNTAIVWGKGTFTFTLDGTKSSAHLGYMEVFIKKDQGWKLIALHASRLPN